MSSSSTARVPDAGSAKAYHHGDLRSALLDAGVRAAREGGIAALSIREVTRAAGVSPNAAYRHFADREALVLAVALEGQRSLAAAMLERMALVPTDDPREAAIGRLRAVGLGYIAFARAEPGFFEVAFATRDERPDGDPSVTVEQQLPEPFLLLLEALDGCVAAGVLSPERRTHAEWACWSTVHGFAVFATSGPLREQPDPVVEALAAHSVESIMRGLFDRP